MAIWEEAHPLISKVQSQKNVSHCKSISLSDSILWAFFHVPCPCPLLRDFWHFKWRFIACESRYTQNKSPETQAKFPNINNPFVSSFAHNRSQRTMKLCESPLGECLSQNFNYVSGQKSILQTSKQCIIVIRDDYRHLLYWKANVISCTQWMVRRDEVEQW